MAIYKVLQDIEAEDKILGPLTLRQFIFGLITAFLLYICFICIAKGAPYLLVIFLPPALLAGFFAYPFGRDQPTEVWAVAKIRFLFKPRRRVWDQSGVQELVTITVPKKVERVLTDGLSQNEVQSRLKVLAKTIDSRGWATKNVNVNLYSHPILPNSGGSDRLVDASSMPQEVPNYDVQPADDMLDEVNNPIAQQFDHMINASTQNHRKQIISEMNDTNPKPLKPADPKPDDYWFMNQPALPANLPPSQGMFASSQVVQPGSDDSAVPSGNATPDEEALAAKLKANNASTQQIYYSHLRTIQPLGSKPTPTSTDQPVTDNKPADDAAALPPTPSPPPHDPAILSLANNNDLNVATLAREAYKAKNPEEPPQDEVIISLH
jgi:PrgI family protein